MSPTNSFPHRELGDLAGTNSVIFFPFFLDLCYFLCILVFCLHVFMFTVYMLDVQGGHKEVSDPLEQEL